MNLLSLCPVPAVFRRPKISFKCRATSSELQAPAGVNGGYSPSHKVTVRDRQRGVVHEFLVPEDQYILHTAEAQDISLPFACRHGCQAFYFMACIQDARRMNKIDVLQTNLYSCIVIFPRMFRFLSTLECNSSTCALQCCCTSCAVRIKSGQIRQPEALGISAELKSKGYALLCVGYPTSDVEVETQDEDEVYWLQFGRYFARGPIERDDYALELAMGDE